MLKPWTTRWTLEWDNGLFSVIAFGFPLLLSGCVALESLRDVLPTTGANVPRATATMARGAERPAMDQLGLSELDFLDLSIDSARSWALPYAVAGVVVKVPLPPGFVDRCIGDAQQLAQLARRDVSVTTLACFEPEAADRASAKITAVLTTLASEDAVTEAEFEQYKRLLRDKVAGVRAAVEGYGASASKSHSPRTLAGAQVLDELRDQRSFVIHAVARPGDKVTLPVVMTTVRVRERLLYLTMTIENLHGRVPWESLARISATWADALLSKTLWSVH